MNVEGVRGLLCESVMDYLKNVGKSVGIIDIEIRLPVCSIRKQRDLQVGKCVERFEASGMLESGIGSMQCAPSLIERAGKRGALQIGIQVGIHDGKEPVAQDFR